MTTQIYIHSYISSLVSVCDECLDIFFYLFLQERNFLNVFGVTILFYHTGLKVEMCLDRKNRIRAVMAAHVTKNVENTKLKDVIQKTSDIFSVLIILSNWENLI